MHHVDPQGTGTLVCGYGQKFATGQHVTFPAIAGHRDANFTDCPGGRLYAQLPDIRKVVARTGQPKIYGFIVEDPAISPNGDGVRDQRHHRLHRLADRHVAPRDPQRRRRAGART